MARFIALLSVLAVMLAACGGGGGSDDSGAADAAEPETTSTIGAEAPDDGGSGDDTEDSTDEDEADSGGAETSGEPLLEACGLLTDDELSTLLGSGTLIATSNLEADDASDCSWTPEDGGGSFSVTIFADENGTDFSRPVEMEGMGPIESRDFDGNEFVIVRTGEGELVEEPDAILSFWTDAGDIDASFFYFAFGDAPQVIVDGENWDEFTSLAVLAADRLRSGERPGGSAAAGIDTEARAELAVDACTLHTPEEVAAFAGWESAEATPSEFDPMNGDHDCDYSSGDVFTWFDVSVDWFDPHTNTPKIIDGFLDYTWEELDEGPGDRRWLALPTEASDDISGGFAPAGTFLTVWDGDLTVDYYVAVENTDLEAFLAVVDQGLSRLDG